MRTLSFHSRQNPPPWVSRVTLTQAVKESVLMEFVAPPSVGVPFALFWLLLLLLLHDLALFKCDPGLH